MSDKPSYLGLLNAIALGEARGHELLKAWAAATQNPELRRELEIISIREAEHAAVFHKRLCELGYDMRQTPSATFNQDIALARSAASDEEKFARLIDADTDAASDDPLSRLFDDPTIDPQTGALLGRFIAEERDSGRRLRAEYNRVCAAAEPKQPAMDDIASLKACVASLEGELQQLRKMIAAGR